MAVLTVQDITESGLSATYSTAAAAGDSFANDSSEKTFIHVKNGSASSMTVTVAPVESSVDVPGFGTVTKASVSVNVAASGDKFIGPFPFEAFGSAPDVTYSDETSVTLAAIKV